MWTKAAILTVLAGPLAAWEFTPFPICTLTHSTAGLDLRLTYDASLPEYVIALTLTDSTWADADAFALQFDGAQPNRIATSRHVITGSTLSVTDTGFGNVLNGLQFNDTATALAGDTTIKIPLAGAAEPVARFRDCPGAPSV